MSGLTIGAAPFLSQAQRRGDLFLEQPYHLYSAANHQTWATLFRRVEPLWDRYANQRFRGGVASLALDPRRIPRLSDVNRFLCARTGFRARAVAGYVPAFEFFDCLRRREFPTTITIRPHDRLDYLPEPDIFHDIAGHVPMHTEPAFADALVRFGDCAHAAAEMAASIQDPAERDARLSSVIRAMARFFWFTVEFGLMRESSRLVVYGSGLLSSASEMPHAVESNTVERRPANVAEIINQPFEIDHFQPLLFVVDGFDHLFQLANDLGEWMRAGKLDRVAGGEPIVSASDLESFHRCEEGRLAC